MSEKYRQQLGEAVAAYLHTLGLLTWSPDYQYTQGVTEWPAYVQLDAPPTPHQLVHIAAGVQTQARLDTVTMVQVRVRGDQDADDSVAEDRLQAIQDAFMPNGRPLVHVKLGGLWVGMVQEVSSTPLGRDSQRRNSLVANFRIRSRRPRAGVTPPTPAGSTYGTGIYGEGIYGA